MKKQLNRILSILLTLSLLFSSTVFPNVNATTASLEAEPVAAILREETSLREEAAKQFLCDDGTYILAAYGTPVHYEENGVWKEIDNRLALSSRALSSSGKATYMPKASALSVSIPQDFSDGQQVTVSNKGFTFGFGISTENQDVSLQSTAALVDAEGSSRSQGNLTGSEQVQELNARKMAVNNLTSTVTYKNVFPDTDLEYSTLPEGIKENFVVAAPQAEYVYLFDVRMDGLAAIPQEDGAILLVEASNQANVIFILEAPYMYDAAGETSYDVEMVLENGVLTVTADAAWLNDEARVFPAVIDPTIIFNTNSSSVIKDAYISSLFPNSNNTNLLRLFTGKALLGERNRTFIP